MGVNLLFMFLTTLITVCNATPTIFNCDEKKETCTNVSTKPTNKIWIIDTGTSFIEYYPKFKLILISHPNRYSAVGQDSDGVFMVFNAKTNSVLLIKNGRAHLLHINKVAMSFSTAWDTWRTGKEVYYKEAVPYLKKLRCGKTGKKGFDIRSLLKHVYKYGTIKGGLPCQKLESSLEKRFGNIFAIVSDLYKSGLATVKEAEAVFYSVVLERTQNNQYLYKWVSSIISNNLKVNNEMVHQLQDGVLAENYTEFKEYSRLYSIVGYLYKTVEEGSAAYKRGDINVTVIDTSCNGTKYSTNFARDTRSGNFAINILSHDGTTNTYILYNSRTWSFYCAITKVILVLPEGKNFGLFNYAAGVGIVACKKTGLATIVKSSDLKQLNDAIVEGLEVTKKVIITAPIGVLEKDSFSFSNFISTSYLSGNATNTLCGVGCKKKLDRYFGNLVKEFRAIEAYDPKDGSANAVLYFFKNMCFKWLTKDYKAIVYAIGTRESMFFNSKVVEATYISTRNMFAV